MSISTTTPIASATSRVALAVSFTATPSVAIISISGTTAITIAVATQHPSISS